MPNSRFLALLVLSFAVGLATPAIAQGQAANSSGCGALFNAGQYGPYDFRTDKDKLQIVTSYHFTPVVEALIRGSSNTSPGPDISYTLHAIPNHPNALLAMMRLGEKEQNPKPTGSAYSVECWFDRAIRFRPDDHVVRMIYTQFLTKNKRKPEAMRQLEIVLNSAKNNAFTHQNVGLLYFDLGEYQKSLTQAHKAIALGLNRPDLREKLRAVGQWVAPTPADAEPEVAEPTTAGSTPTKP